MKIEKFEDLVGQFSQYGLVIAPQFRTNILSQSLNGSVVATVSESGEKKVYVGIKYPDLFVKKISGLHSYLIVGKVDTNLNLTIYQ